MQWTAKSRAKYTVGILAALMFYKIFKSLTQHLSSYEIFLIKIFSTKIKYYINTKLHTSENRVALKIEILIEVYKIDLTSPCITFLYWYNRITRY